MKPLSSSLEEANERLFFYKKWAGSGFIVWRSSLVAYGSNILTT
jgi:hypothetical protein